MLATCLAKLAAFFSPSGRDPQDTCDVSSFELVDLDRRLRLLDSGGYPFRLHSNAVPRDWDI